MHHKDIRDELSNEKNYKTMYKKLFDVYSGNYTTLEFETAVQLWEVYLKGKCAFYKQLLDFLNKLIEGGEKNRVHRDLWDMMYEFVSSVKDINKDYNEADGWPVFIDKMVDQLKAQK